MEGIMHRSFGMETRQMSTRWEDVQKGPPLSDVREHIRKLANFTAQTTATVSRFNAGRDLPMRMSAGIKSKAA
jgi:hypothetical protein